jgi:hypothetical protein
MVALTPLVTWKGRTASLPLTESTLAPGPSISRSSAGVSLRMVSPPNGGSRTMLPVTPEAKTMSSLWPSELAAKIASLRVQSLASQAPSS